MELIIVTGLSGAGRRSVLGALEDAGCMALDNVPARLLEPLLRLESRLNPSRVRLAVGMDSRHADFAREFEPLLDHLQNLSIPCHVIFLEASDEVLLRRFSESRRPHHLAPEGSVAEGVAQERRLLAPIRAQATTIIDTSKLSLADLRKRLGEALPEVPAKRPTVRVLSFGFKHGIPLDADMVFDARFLPNPHYVPDLKPLTGRDEPVQRYLLDSGEFRAFLSRMEEWVRWAYPQLESEGRAYYTVAVGCTGGQHRSVALAELMGQRLREGLPSVLVQHRDAPAQKAS